MEEKKPDRGRPGRMLVLAVVLATILTLVSPTYAWFGLKRTLGAYAPLAKPEALYIGAGHRNFEDGSFTDDHFEDIRYLYFNGIDADDGRAYYDYVFCVYGKAISGYRLQLAYTTNNQFEYEIYHAAESTVDSEGAVEYVTHEDTPATYYYTAVGSKLNGAFLNDQTVDGETIADDAMHLRTYGSYDDVQKYAEPLYWQSSAENGEIESGNPRGDFINYYILRVKLNGKTVNDRETDVICIAAKSYSLSSSSTP